MALQWAHSGPASQELCACLPGGVGVGEAEQCRWDSSSWESDPCRPMPSKGGSQRGRTVTAEKILSGHCGAGGFNLSRVGGQACIEKEIPYSE